ncbi:glycosyltransferase family 2 protein [Aestuariivivens insulae]|uniref:glycosyltransferase family 2 protein n=1 Tax=Aestuariivivens insulae TaxID=1621988 RepID=UPI001F5825EB|nr:glycosyltransferase family 2 protein [Aestuariivivens insulae]
MKLSIIIPVYNNSKFIDQSYRMVIQQELDDFEIIYVDNNSVDQSVSLIEQICLKDSRVQLYHQRKQGAGASRNLGISKANGEHVYLFDVDDEIYPGVLKRMIKILDTTPEVDAVFGKMVKSHKGIANTKKPTDETLEVIVKNPPDLGIRWFGDLRTVVGPPAFLYRKAVFKKIGFYNEALRLGEDTAFDIRLGMLCKVAAYDAYVYLYRKHNLSTTQKAKKQESMIFHTWKRLVLEHLPFYVKYEPLLAYKRILFHGIFSAMGKLIFYTKGLHKRVGLVKQIHQDIVPIRLPFYITLYLWLLVLLPIKILLKVYVYWIAKPYVARKLSYL